MKKWQCRNGWLIGLCCLLFGCAVNTPAPVSGLNKDYNSIPRGSYRGSYYEVKKGDTLYFISYITDKDVNDIIRFNRLQAPYVIHPGQKLRLWGPVYTPPAYAGTGAGPRPKANVSSVGSVASASTPVVVPAPVVIAPSVPVKSKDSNPVSISQNSKKPPTTVNKSPTTPIEQPKTNRYVETIPKVNVTNQPVTKPTQNNDKIAKWLWPTKGRVIKGFSAGDQGNKGIDIAGQRGQSIVSTAAGTVVYSGNALRGYGNLIIIKHNDDYLSAYAHNDQLLVQEGQNVTAGQKIATMGSSGTTSVRLHFEIRYQGKPVNPQRYLP
ncbi:MULTISPECIES: murein hydrolase activator NlpD [Vibrio]|uniref:murein hydrolase activator NlpD n=1 Tax=Vibrio TaxID=662 RepID=UPI001481DB10|nr:murein hydrolase activator NlpD [Vibrio sp. A8-1]NNN83294.1 murein hydrolase activator NlpD [Vibrio sp. A8-1]